MINKMSIADAMRSVMTQLRKQTAENNKAREAKTVAKSSATSTKTPNC